MKATRPYFSHDIAAKTDKKIICLMFDFRKKKQDFSEQILQELLPHAAYAIYWEIIEYLHENMLKTDELEMLSDVLRVDSTILEKILNDYDLFKIKDGNYISERVLKNLMLQEEKSEKAKQSANKRYIPNPLLSAFSKYYEEFFDEKPVLQSSEIEALKRYNDQIPDLKDKLRDIIYTLKNLKFDTDIDFKPGANWLLKGNNLAKLVNGEFGTLRHRQITMTRQK